MTIKVFDRLKNPPHCLFPKGTILWRQVAFHARHGIGFPPFPWEKAKKDSYMCKLQLYGNFLGEPELFPSKDGSGGVIVFTEIEPPPNWTHLKVRAVSKKMEQIEAGGAIFAEVCPPASDYLEWRARMMIAQTKNHTLEERLLDVLTDWPRGYKPGDRRLLYEPRHDGTGLADYAHITITVPASSVPEATSPQCGVQAPESRGDRSSQETSTNAGV